jgi:isovaleryl-CoA dehydrogenase
MGMTEPGAGTDVLAMTTTATRDGDSFVLNGTKTYITNGCEGYCFLVYAKVDGKITAFVVDRGARASRPRTTSISWVCAARPCPS